MQIHTPAPWYQTCKVVAVFGRHLHSRLELLVPSYRLTTIGRRSFPVAAQSSGTHCLSICGLGLGLGLEGSGLVNIPGLHSFDSSLEIVIDATRSSDLPLLSN